MKNEEFRRQSHTYLQKVSTMRKVISVCFYITRHYIEYVKTIMLVQKYDTAESILLLKNNKFDIYTPFIGEQSITVI